MIEVKLQFNTAAEAAAALGLLSGNATAAASPKPAVKAGETAAAAKPASTPKPPAEAAKVSLDYDKDIKPHIVAAGAKHGRDGIVKFLTDTFGVGTGKELTEEQRVPATVEKIKAFLATDADVA